MRTEPHLLRLPDGTGFVTCIPLGCEPPHGWTRVGLIEVMLDVDDGLPDGDEPVAAMRVASW